MTELQTRFLRAIVAHIGGERIVDVHLFPSIRQGPQETGVAVVAAMPEGYVAPAPAAPVAEEAVAHADEPAEAVAEAPGDAEDAAEAAAETEAVAEAPAAEDADAPDAEPVASVEPAAPEAPAVRHVVYSARYRAVLKGPERGKWEVDVVAEADAPLITVEAVVRGMRQRSSDAGDPERIDGDALRALLEAAWSQPA